MTNDDGPERDLLRVFASTRDGKITMEGPLLGSLFAHDPYIISDLEEVECTFEALNPSYFNRDPIVDGFIGQAVGDAFGVPVEFLSRDEVRSLDLQEMIEPSWNYILDPVAISKLEVNKALLDQKMEMC